MPRTIAWMAVTVAALAGAATLSSADAPKAANLQPTTRPFAATSVYAPGDRVGWAFPLPKGAARAQWVAKRGAGSVIAEGTLERSADGSARIDLGTIAEPQSILVTVTPDAGPKFLLGAVVAPEQLRPAAGPPDDFDAFWADQVKASAAIPLDAKLEESDSGEPGVRYFKVTLRAVDGTTIHAQLARPDDDAKHPAMLILPFAGVYGQPKAMVTNRAKRGWIAMQMSVHDAPQDRDAEFYRALAEGTLKNYTSIGNGDRETSYLRRAVLSAYRSADHLTTLPQWDGKALVVNGNSQGGYLSIATASLHPKVTALCVAVPAGCETLAHRDGRVSGWPYWYGQAAQKDDSPVLTTSRYLDATNFARRVRCPALVAVGLVDTTCPSWGVIATANVMQGPTELVVLPFSDHKGTNNTRAPYEARERAWLTAIANGEAPPVRPSRRHGGRARE